MFFLLDRGSNKSFILCESTILRTIYLLEVVLGCLCIIMLSKKCHCAARRSQRRWLRPATKGVRINNGWRRERGQGPGHTKGLALQRLHRRPTQVRLPRQRSVRGKNKKKKRGGHAGATSRKHLNTSAAHTFSKRKQKKKREKREGRSPAGPDST